MSTHPTIAPDLPGSRRFVETTWGSSAYRLIEGDTDKPPLVLVHGWGKSADSSWWPIIADCDRTMLAVDLPGHGISELDQPFTFDLAAEAVLTAIEHSGLDRPTLVAHSMGGPIALTAIRHADADHFSGLLALATSAYWVRPRIRIMMTMAPYAMSGQSPVLVHTTRSELRQMPEVAPHIAWAYTRRPVRQLLHEGAVALRRFDARKWDDLTLPPTTWVVATKDTVLPPAHQYASAELFEAEVVEVDTQHSLVVQAPDEVLAVLENSSSGCSAVTQPTAS